MSDTLRNTLLIGLGILAVVVAVMLLSERSEPESSGDESDPLTQPVTEVTVAQFGDLLLYLPLYIAESEGIFDRHGLEVDIVSTGGDDKTYAAVASGGADFGIADPTFVALAAEQGLEGYVVGLLINGMPNYGVSLSGDTPSHR